MKKVLSFLVCVLFFSIPSYGATIITSPIDSRPVSCEYLEKLASINGDKVLLPSEKYLDFFSADGQYRFANSQRVRDEIYSLVSLNNNEDTTVIINTSSYLNRGLVGTRCGTSYNDNENGLKDMEKLIRDNPNPRYYVNLFMPRNLPETRGNTVWDTEDKQEGLVYFYLQENESEDVKLKELKMVSPSQLLLEYGYVYSKKYELGETALTSWESKFLKRFEEYKKTEPYKSYLYNYKLPYVSVSNTLSRLLKWQEEGLIDEIILCADDRQLPDSVAYLKSIGVEVPMENGAEVKFSFARIFSEQASSQGFERQIAARFGNEELEKARQGLSDKINFIYGCDEISQLIYARDLTKRNGRAVDYSLKKNPSAVREVAKFDVVSADKLLEYAVNFVNANQERSKEMPFFLYLYDYGAKAMPGSAFWYMERDYNEAKAVGLIELYSAEVSASGDNKLFKRLLLSDNAGFSIADLGSYSAWNTNANAIGLGVASSQVFAQTAEKRRNNPELLENQLEMLAEHIIEDGIYTVNGKRLLYGYIPSDADRPDSQRLLEVLNIDEVRTAFENKAIGDNNIAAFDLTTYYFPWQRPFECYLEIEMDME